MVSSHRVVLRHLIARAQLRPVLEQIEHAIAKEDWKAARDAVFELGKTVGLIFSGIDSLRVSTEWVGALDNEDSTKFMEEFLPAMKNIYEAVAPLALGRHGRPFEPMWMDKQLEKVRHMLPWVQDIMRDESDSFRHKEFLIIPTKGVHNTDEAVKTLDEAAKHVESKFPKVLYGKVYVREGLRSVGTYDARPGSGSQTAGAYQAATDTMFISMYAVPNRNSVMTLIHELGHRYHTRFLKGEERERFIKLSTEGEMIPFTREERVRAADEYVELFRHHQQEDYPEPGTILSPKTREYGELYPREAWKKIVGPWRRKFIDDKDNSVERELHKAIAYSVSSEPVEFPAVPDHTMQEKGVFASEYGRTSWMENFAESFLAFCLGTPLPPPLERFMKSL